MQDWYRSFFGASKGIVSAMRAGCCCNVKDPDENVDSESESEHSEDEGHLLTKTDAPDLEAGDIDPSGGSIDDRGITSNPDSDSDSVF